MDIIITTELVVAEKTSNRAEKLATIDRHVEAFLLVLYQMFFINILDRERVPCTSCVWDGPSKFISVVIIFVFDLIG